jgi:hypothetical protein
MAAVLARNRGVSGRIEDRNRLSTLGVSNSRFISWVGATRISLPPPVFDAFGVLIGDVNG